MTQKKIKPVDQYAFLTINVDTFTSAVNMSVNGQARDRRQNNDNVSLYSFGCDVEIQGTCTYPPERVHENYRIGISTKPQSQLDFDAKLKDTRVRDEDGSFKYRKVRNRSLPVYDIPEGLGLLDTRRKSPTRGYPSLISEWYHSLCVLDMPDDALCGISSRNLLLCVDGIDPYRLTFLRRKLRIRPAIVSPSSSRAKCPVSRR
jgi:hypothetical protein